MSDVLRGTVALGWVKQANEGFMAVRKVEKLLDVAYRNKLLTGIQLVAAKVRLHEDSEPATEEWLAEREGTGEAFKKASGIVW